MGLGGPFKWLAEGRMPSALSINVPGLGEPLPVLLCWVQTRFLIGNRAAGVVMAEPVRARRLTDQEGQRLQQIVRRGKHGLIPAAGR